MSTPFFINGNLHHTEVDNLLERIENSTDEELKQLEIEFAEKSSHFISVIDDRLIEPAKTNKAFVALMASLKIPNQLGSGATEVLMCRATNYAVKGFITTTQFEEMAKKLIDGVNYDHQAGYYTGQHALNVALTRALQTMAGAKFFKGKNLSILDQALAQDIKKESMRIGPDYSMQQAREIVRLINLPETVKSLLDVSLNNPQSFHLQGTIRNLFVTNKLSDEYIQVAISVVDVDVFCKICRDAYDDRDAITSMNNFIGLLGEDALIDKKIYKKMSGEIYAGVFPANLQILADRNLKVEQMPNFTTFAMRNLEALYPLIKPDNLSFRYRILDICVNNGMAKDVLDLEVSRWKKSLGLPSTLAVSGGEVLMTMRSSKPKDYQVALQTLLSIGLLNAEPVLSGVDAKTWRDLMAVHDPEADEKKAVMKRYPVLRGAMLEDELGL